MGKRGPSPTPTRRLQLRGSWRANTRPGEPTPPPAKPKPPAWLSKDAKAVFSSLVRRLYAEGMVTRVEEESLALYADLFVQYRLASEFTSKYGAVYAIPGRPGPDGKVMTPPSFRVYPQAERARQLAGDLMRLGDRLGLTPAARARMVTGPTAPAAPQYDHYFQPVRVSG